VLGLFGLIGELFRILSQRVSADTVLVGLLVVSLSKLACPNGMGTDDRAAKQKSSHSHPIHPHNINA
jgi:hypothetical protein